MTLHFTATIHFNVKRNGQAVDGLTDLPAQITSIGGELSLVQNAPGVTTHMMIFQDRFPLKLQDQLINTDDDTEIYRVTSLLDYPTPRAAHTEVVGERRWGTD
jgi:hypothetical protein